uniref:Osteocalcin n=1 Tax=Gopherus agassizii TaxID=38772 RepID=A0A452I3D4_9SAUR
ALRLGSPPKPCRAATGQSRYGNAEPSGAILLTPPLLSALAAFVSKQDSPRAFYDLIHDPLEGKREICELNPDCDELADHIGFQEAYRRYYGPV